MADFPVALLTLSDSRSIEGAQDVSGAVLREIVLDMGGVGVDSKIIPDDLEGIKSQLKNWADSGTVALILTTGGTGVGPRDNTPEATMDVVDKTVPGIGEQMRKDTSGQTSAAILSRQTAGIRGKCLIVNLPGSPQGVKECMDSIADIIPHALDMIYFGDTSH